ncbi:MAG: radical SAM protein [Lentisphaeria bacterium]|nr:radical SAM protein [Lentisphaeria bacterium]
MDEFSGDMIYAAGLEDDSIVNGPGLRFVLFVQGCNKRCRNCHNPQTQPLRENGSWYNIEEIFAAIKSNPLTSGVTFSGGEPFLQAAVLAKLGAKIKSAGLELAIYTGYKFEELFNSSDPGVHALLKVGDILVDGEFIDAQTGPDLLFKGSRNQRVLDLSESLAEQTAVLSRDERWLIF